jgi:hypothetical protein
MSRTMFLIHYYHPLRFMDYSKNRNDPGVGPSQPCKVRKKSIIMWSTPLDDIEEEEPDLPLRCINHWKGAPETT